MNTTCKKCFKDITNEMLKNCDNCDADLRSEIPNTHNLRLILNNLEYDFKESLESVQKMILELDNGHTINNQTEKTDYMNLDDIDYLIQDYRMDNYSPFMIEIQKLKDFKEILDNFESTDYLNW